MLWLRRTSAAARARRTAACSAEQKMHHLQQCLQADSVRAEVTSSARRVRHAVAGGCAKFHGRSRSAAGARAPNVGGAAGDGVAAMPSGDGATGRRGERKKKTAVRHLDCSDSKKGGCVCIGF